mgnify:FL=1
MKLMDTFRSVGVAFATILLSLIPLLNGHAEKDGLNSMALSVVTGNAKAGAFASSIQDPANLGLNANSVNLYTGQHQESFPLVSIPGRGGLGFSVSLDYNGNVYKQSKQENRKGQASAFGLGFSIGISSVVVDHKGTLDIWDDDYKLILDNTAIELKKKTSTQYVPQSAQPWIITRRIDTVAYREVVTGWTLVKEDGTIFRFGDFAETESGWNATRQMLRYGDFVGNGITNDDSLYAYQWDLKLVQDRDSLNWVAFTYKRDQRNTQVRHKTNDTLVSSINSYTAASHFDSIVTADGGSVRFFYSSRNDNDLFFGINNQEFVALSKCDYLLISSQTGLVTTKIAFEYTYLNSSMYANYGAPLEKLMLRRIKRWLPDNSSSLPPIAFDYDSSTASPTYGAMVKITYPTGGIKMLGYEELDDANNFTKLDVMSMDSSTQKPKSYWADNIFLLWKGGTSWTVGYWDGYWNTLDFSASDSVNDAGAVSNDGWAVVPTTSTGNNLTVLRWRGGYWQVDTISNAIARLDDVRLYIGDDCFLVCDGVYNNEILHVWQAKFFRWNGENWRGWEFKSVDPSDEIVDCQLFNNIIVMSTVVTYPTWDGVSCSHGVSQISSAYYSNRLDSLIYSPDWNVDTDCQPTAITNIPITLGHNYFAWHDYYSGSSAKVRWKKWDGQSWSQGETSPGDLINSRTSVSNGFAINKSRNDGSYSFVRSYYPSATGFFSVDFSVNSPSANQQVNPLYGGNNVLGGYYSGENNGYDWWFWRWNGLNWRYTGMVADGAQGTDGTMLNYGVSWFWGPVRWGDQYPGQIAARSFHGIGGANMSPPDSGWPATSSIVDISTNLHDGFGAGDQMFLCRTSAHYMYLNNLFYFGTTWHPLFIRDVLRPGGTSPGDAYAAYGAQHETFYMYNCNRFPIDTILGNIIYQKRYWQYGYKLVDTTFAGKAPIYVVDSVLTYRFADDTSPTIQKYKYFGGLLDPSGTTLRFAKAEISTPYFASEGGPDGYEVHCFYNDIDTTGFYDPTIYNTMAFPDLKSSARYGIANGGFRMDGTEYYSYSYTVGDAVAKKNDYSKSFHSWSQTLDSLPDVYHQKTDSVFVRQDSLTSHIYYKYDARNGQVCRTAAKYVGTNAYIIDSVIFAYQNNSNMLTDNALVQASEQIRRFDSNGVAVKTLKKSGSTFTRKGSWQVDKSFTWRNLANLNDTLFTFKTLPSGQSFDAYGNLIASVNANGDTSCVKVGSDGMTPVASVSNCSQKEVLAQDFEQSLSWDSWVQYNTTYKWIDSTVSFTGRKSLYVTDDPGSSDRNWASTRTIYKSDIANKIFYFSGWARSNGTVTAYCFAYNSADSLCVGGYKSKSFNLASSGGSSWQRIEGWFDLSNVWSTMDHVHIQLVLENGIDKFAYFDDFRFHPVDAVVSTMVVDNTRGLVVSRAGATNYPTTTEYDSYQRPIISKDFKGRTLGKSSYYLSLSDHSKFDTLNPNSVKTIKFRTDADSVVSISYFDGIGRTLQNRSSDQIGASVAALVSGIATYDGPRQGDKGI